MNHKLLTNAAMRFMVMKGKASLRHLEKASEAPMEENLALLMKILQNNRNTEYGRAHHFGDITTVEEFRKQVPISGYEDFAPYIERMKNGEENLLTSSKVLGY